MEDASKGIFWLPRIVQHLPAGIHLTIAGDGPDLPKLKARMAPHAYRVTFLGAVGQADVPALMAQHDIIIMPSRYEGLPMTLIEAMAAGCVPVVSNIRGVTDTIIDHDSNGLLFPIGDFVAAAGLVGRLHHDYELLGALSSAAEKSIASKFRATDMASRYHGVIRLVERQRPKLAPTLDIGSWSMPAGLRPGLRSYLPAGVKNWLRTMRERA
jgi:glycosyltransferase involved in cell wall biosynthesis